MLVYLIVTFFSFLGVLLYRQFALRAKIMDIPNERSSHIIPTPRGGGVAVALVWFVALVWLYFSNVIYDSGLFYALLCGILLAIVGTIDDLYDISPKIRLATQVSASAGALFFLGGMHKADLGFYVIENGWFLTAIAFVAIIWFVNLFNFVDGIDGYLGTETVIVGLATGWLFGISLSFVLASVTLGFLFLNWPKAKIFMGDVGSTLLGFTILVLGIYYQNTGTSSIVIWLMLTSLFWVDATITVIRRFLNKEALMTAHRKHAYQRIVQSGFSHRKTLLYSIGVNAGILGLVLLAVQFPKFIILIFAINLVWICFIYYLIEKRKPFPKIK